MIILGLDVSTSCTGICVVDSSLKIDESGSHIKLLTHCSLSKCKTFWEKADVIESVLSDILHRQKLVPTVFALEEPLLGFQKGMSSATTITTLMRFNGIVSYIGRRIFEVDPTYISSSHARKLCGIKMQRTSIAGMNGKEQVFKHMSENDLKHVDWPKKKNGSPVDASRDMTDAYVIARAACLV